MIITLTFLNLHKLNLNIIIHQYVQNMMLFNVWCDVWFPHFFHQCLASISPVYSPGQADSTLTSSTVADTADTADTVSLGDNTQ